MTKAFRAVAKSLRSSGPEVLPGYRESIISVPVLIHVRVETGKVGHAAYPSSQDVQAMADAEINDEEESRQ
jgi:hypothetical protein